MKANFLRKSASKLLIRKARWLYFIAILCFITPQIMAWDDNLNDRLFAYYSFDNASTTLLTDDYKGYLTGTAFNVVSSDYITGKYQKAFNFSTLPYFQLGQNIPSMCATCNVTISVWFNTSAGSGNLHFIATRYWAGVAGKSGWSLFFNMDTKIIRLYDGQLGDYAWSSNLPANLNDSNYHHLLFMRGNIAGVNGTMYIDGAKLTPTVDTTLSDMNPSTPVHIQIGNSTTGTTAQMFKGVMDEFAIWNRTLNTTEIYFLYNGSGNTYNQLSSTLDIPADNLQVLSMTNQSFNCSGRANENLMNISLLTNSTGVLGINQTVDLSSSSVKTFTKEFIFHEKDKAVLWNCQVCTATACINGSNSRTILFKALRNNSISYNATTTEGGNEGFVYNVTIASGDSLVSAYLIYNKTQYSTSVTTIGNDYILSKTLAIESVTAEANRSFYFSVNLASGQFNSSLYNQTVLNMEIDNCTTNSLKILNFSLVNEETQTIINGTIDVDISIYPIGSETLLMNYTRQFVNVTNGSICLAEGSLNYSQYSMDMQVRYSSSGYAPEFYNVQNYILSNSTIPNQIQLFDLLSTDSTDFLITYKDSNFIPIEDALILIKRKYVSEGVFKTVEIPKTDSSGQAIGHFDTDGVLYSITVTKDGVNLAVFNNIAVICTDRLTGDCKISLNEISSASSFIDYTRKDNLNYYMSFNKTTRTISVAFNTIDGTSAVVLLNATKYDRFGNLTICTNSLTSSSGSFACIIPSQYDNMTFVSSLYKDGELIVQEVYSMFPSARDKFGYDGVVMVLLLILTIPMMFMGEKIGIVIGLLIGVLMAMMLMIYEGGNIIGVGSAFVWLVISGGILIYKFTQRGGGQ